MQIQIILYLGGGAGFRPQMSCHRTTNAVVVVENGQDKYLSRPTKHTERKGKINYGHTLDQTAPQTATTEDASDRPSSQHGHSCTHLTLAD